MAGWRGRTSVIAIEKETENGDLGVFFWGGGVGRGGGVG